MNVQGHFSLRDVPKIKVGSRRAGLEVCSPDARYTFSYDAPEHEDLPHVVKFSGGRTSGMLLLMLLEGGILKAERGDVIVFNNTTAEHPETYKFTARCKRLVEEQYGVPFFWTEFQTYEDARRGEWTRLPTYRLVKPAPWSEEEPDGYHWQGEAFEEMLSWSGYVPNQFQRICTKNLKLEVTKSFLHDWFAGEGGVNRQGHYGAESRLDDDELYARHRKSRGSVPRDIFLQKKAFVRTRPVFRPEQAFKDFSSIGCLPVNGVAANTPGKAFAVDEESDIEYTAFVGLRNDEMRRVVRVRQRNLEDVDTDTHQGEYVYMPLASMGITKDDVNAFWGKQDWDLQLPAEAGLSNCVYCFLKGAGGLQKVHSLLQNGNDKSDNGAADLSHPCSISWWMRLEDTYSRDIVAEKRVVRNKEDRNVIGFFGLKSGFSYKLLAQNGTGRVDISHFSDTVLPCDCTD